MVSTGAPEMTSSARQEIVSTAAPEMTKSTAESAISPMTPTTHAAIWSGVQLLIYCDDYF